MKILLVIYTFAYRWRNSCIVAKDLNLSFKLFFCLVPKVVPLLFGGHVALDKADSEHERRLLNVPRYKHSTRLLHLFFPMLFCLQMSFTAFSPASTAMSEMQTLAPSATKRRANSRPRPLAPPVMMARRSLTVKGGISNLNSGICRRVKAMGYIEP
jgi:hypothetical protein